MTLHVPLGVRIFNNWGRSFDIWVTEWLERVQFRSVIPGGFANATITLHNSKPDLFSQIVRLYNRVQIIDWQIGQTIWEGRIEEPKRNVQSHSWEIGCLGGMVVASDVRIPYFAIDGKVSNWRPATAAHADYTGPEVDDVNNTLTFKPQRNEWNGPDHWSNIFDWDQGYRCDMRIGRFDATYEGSGSSNWRTGIDVITPGQPDEINIDLTAWNAVKVRKGNSVNGSSSFTSEEAQALTVAFDFVSASQVMTEGEWGAIIDPRVQAQRVDRFGNKLTNASTDYPNDYCTVPQIVEDVVGRFLCGNFHWVSGGVPFAAEEKVRPQSVFIDSTATAKITDLTFYDGATAADVLDQCMNAQPNQYWAIWESDLRTESQDSSFWGFSFEWRNWDDFWTYRVTSEDGFEEQPDGESPYNGVYLIHSREDFPPPKYVQTNWRAVNATSNADLDNAALNRIQTVIREEPLASSAILPASVDELTKMARTKNTGKIKINRPIHCYDPGTNGRQGMNQMVSPWRVRPGRMMIVTDQPVQARLDPLTFGSVPRGLDTSVYKMVGTTYDSDTGLEVDLDQVHAWDVANQIVKASKPVGRLVVKG